MFYTNPWADCEARCDRYEEVAEALAETVRHMRVDDPANPETEIGPLVARRQQERVEGYITIGQHRSR